MLKKAVICIILTLVSLLPVMAEEEVEIFTNTNINSVSNNTQYYTEFTISSNCEITRITTYHWNNGNGSYPGTISLKDSNGIIIGTWEATPRVGQGDVPNAYWDVFPYITLLPGTYTIIDSEPSTWACNENSGYKGMSWVYGMTESVTIDGEIRFCYQCGQLIRTGAERCVHDIEVDYALRIRETIEGKRGYEGYGFPVPCESCGEYICSNFPYCPFCGSIHVND